MRMPLLQQAVRDHDCDGALKYCTDVRQAMSEAHTNLRHIVQQFRAPMDPLGLKHALHVAIAAFHEHTQIELSLDDRAPDLRFSALQELQVLRIVQEALANIAKHARAHHAWLSIARSAGGVDVVIEDDGGGLGAAPAGDDETHFGLDIMRRRAERLGGRLEIGARAAGGTRLRLHVPEPSPARTPAGSGDAS
jgi:two-component system nitrate/nitrite sensor histidine kinase NarX